MAQAATEMMLKLTVLSLIVLSTQGNGQYFRRLRFRDYELKSDPVSMKGLQSVELPGIGSQVLDRREASPQMNLRSPAARAFLVRGSTTNPLLGNMPLFPNFIQTFISQDPDGDFKQSDPFSGANPFASLFAVPNVIVISSANGLKPPVDGGVPQGEPTPGPGNNPKRGNFMEARSVLPTDGLRNMRFENLLDY